MGSVPPPIAHIPLDPIHQPCSMTSLFCDLGSADRENTLPHLDFCPATACLLADPFFRPHRMERIRIIKVKPLLILDDSWGWTDTVRTEFMYCK